MFERLKEALDSMLDAATPAGDSREALGRMHDAIVETRVALDSMREGIEVTEGKLADQRKRLDDAERRGGLARGIDDDETVRVAEQYAAKHRERVHVLERKLEAQQEEMRLAEREFDEMREKLRLARAKGTATDSDARIEAAWRDIESAGGARPETDVNDELLSATFDRAAREARAQEQLERLKKKMGR